MLETKASDFNEAASKYVASHFLRPISDLTISGKASIQVIRDDLHLFAPLYPSTPERILCLKEGEVDASDWSVSFQSYFTGGGRKNYYGSYAPSLREYDINNVSAVQDPTSKSCLAMTVGPNSAAVTIVYTANETYIK